MYVLIAVVLMALGPMWFSCLEDSAGQPSLLQLAPSKESTEAEGTVLKRLSLSSEGKTYVGVLNLSLEVRLYEGSEDKENLVFSFGFSRSDIASGAKFLVVADFNGDGNEELAWKFCRAHFCPFENGAIVYEVSTEKLFCIRYSDGDGLTLSKNLKDLKHRKFHVWLEQWLNEWPASGVDFDKLQRNWTEDIFGPPEDRRLSD